STYLYDDALKHARVLHEEHSFPTRRSSDLSIQKSGKKELELCLYVLILKPHSRLQKRSLRLAGYSPIQTAGLQSDNLHHRALNHLFTCRAISSPIKSIAQAAKVFVIAMHIFL